MNEEFETYIANAIHWAQEHLGSTAYAARCLAFVEDAYEEGNHVEIFGGSSAQESADEYEAAQNRGEPRSVRLCSTIALARSGTKSKIGDTSDCISAQARLSTPGIRCGLTIISNYRICPLLPAGRSLSSLAGRRSKEFLWDIGKSPEIPNG